MGGHNRAEARARSSGEIAGRALGGKAAPDGAKRQRAVLRRAWQVGARSAADSILPSDGVRRGGNAAGRTPLSAGRPLPQASHNGLKLFSERL